MWHPLYLHDEAARDELLQRAGIEPLPHRSQECAPCVNANRSDLTGLTDAAIRRVEALETEVGKPMFWPDRFKQRKYPDGCHGIRQVIQWAHKAPIQPEDEQSFSQCSSGYCGI